MALDARLRELRVGLLTDLAEEAPDEPGRCPACGAALVRRGDRLRTLRTQGDREVRLHRPYSSCPACGAGLFPPR